MADVEITVGGRRYAIYCRDGEEAHLARLAGAVDAKAEQARKAAPGLTEVRQLLFAALFLADDLHELSRQPAGKARDPMVAPNGDPAEKALESLALRLETLVERLAPAVPAP